MITKEWGELSFLQRKNKWIGALVVVLCCTVYAGFLSTKGMPPAEGWYSYYAYLINEQGAIPYVDFELLFPPLYTYLIAGFTAIFGYSIIALRIFGVVIYALTGLFAFLIFDKLTRKPIFSVFAGILAVSILQSEIVQVFYDYIRLMDLSVYASIYFLICAVERIEKSERFSFLDPMLLLGIMFAVFASMFKQSSGLIYLLFCLIFLIFAIIVLPKRKSYAKALAASAAVIVVMYGIMFLLLLKNGAFSNYLYYNFKAATAAKGGSLIMVLFGFLFRGGPMLIVYALVIMAVMGGLWWLCRYLSRRFPRGEDEKDINLPVWISLLALIVVVMIVLAMLGYNKLHIFGPQKPFTAFIVAMSMFAIISISMIVARVKKKAPSKDAAVMCFFTGAVFILAYSVCTSGGLTESQIALGYPLVVMLFLPVLQFRKKEFVALILAALMLLHSFLGFERKTRVIYSWWGLQVGSVAEQTETVDIPLLRGIRMNKTYAEMYTGVVKEVQMHTEEGEEIFVFPHMPILYLMCDRPKATNTALQWFDISTDKAVLDDIEVIRQKKPKVIIASSISDGVIGPHEASFRQGEKSGLNEMQEFLNKFYVEEGYIERASYDISPGYTVTVWLLP